MRKHLSPNERRIGITEYGEIARSYPATLQPPHRRITHVALPTPYSASSPTRTKLVKAKSS
ncbi:MAG: hypothetical protein KME55_33895 [Nostoc indistinguendum CM1-VF10]|jgi:hypothetical protein|nr:hypothetical protein [Nostoc desertorum CM1-VF14]MBW4457261.1 hypothetical protein [Nostoc indistinguendum CM1-VF10]